MSVVISHRFGTYGDEPDVMIVIEATLHGSIISALYADIHTGQIMNVETQLKYRREGYARSLIAYAVDNGIELLHSPEWAMSDDGAAFAAACDDIGTIADEDAYYYEEYLSIFPPEG